MLSVEELHGWDKAVERVDDLIAAAKNDDWMVPTTDPPRESESRTDYGNWIQEETEGWEQTCQFDIQYGMPMRDLARSVAERNNLHGERWIGIYEELKNHFWEGWEQFHKTAEHWAKHIAR